MDCGAVVMSVRGVRAHFTMEGYALGCSKSKHTDGP